MLGDAHAQAMLQALRTMKSLLFVGVGGGLEDPNFHALLAWSRKALAPSHYQHYRLEREQDVEARQKLHSSDERLFVVPYGKEFSDLAPFLRSLAPPRRAAPALAPAAATVAAELPDVPAELSAAGAEGHLVVLLGADVARRSGLPGWDELLDDLLQRARQETSDPARQKDLEDAAAEWASWELRERAFLIRQTIGETRLREAIAERFRSAGAPTAIHQELARLPGAMFITTSYDQMLEAAIEARTGKRPRVVLPEDIEGLKALSPGQVLKLHGDAETPESIVFWDEAPFRAGDPSSAALKERLVALLAPPHKLLLIGYGARDAGLLQILNELRSVSGEASEKPFWLAKQGRREEVKAKADSLRPIWLRDDAHVSPWLDRLAVSVESRRRETTVMQMARTMAEHVLEGFAREHEEASKHFDAHDYEDARRVYRAMADRADALAARATEDGDTRAELARWGARCRLNVGACVLCLQQTDEALVVLRDVAQREASLLSPGQRATLSQGLALLGELRMAREAMPAKDDAAKPPERAHVAMVEQLLDILEGRLPEHLIDHPLLHLHAARHHFRRGDLEAAAAAASRVLEGSDPLLYASAIFVLVRCLLDTTWERPGVTRPLPAPRDEVVRRIDEGFERLSAMKLPEAVAGDTARLRALYDYQTDNVERRAQASALLPKKDPSIHEAPALLEGAPPWLSAYAHVHTSLAESGYRQAAEEAVALAQRWPGRAPIEYLAARVLGQVGRAEEALEHAQRAFAELPGRGYRLLLGQCLLASGQVERAWETLQALGDSSHLPVLRARAIAAQNIPARITEARGLWERYLGARQDDAWARLQLASTLFRLGERPKAADEAWRAATGRGSERLDAASLYACADMQRFDGAGGEEVRTRILKIVERLRERFPGNVEAEHLRLRLLTALGFPEDAPAPAWKQLEEAGRLSVLTTEQVRALFLEQVHRHASASALYHAGKVSFELLCAVSQIDAAVHVHQFFVASQTTPGPMSPPAAVGEPASDLAGCYLLAGELELLLLQKLGLIRALRSALGQDGRLLLFNDVLNRILGAVYLHEGVDTPTEGAARLALDLQQALGAGIAEGWVQPIERPVILDLPPLRALPQKEEDRIWLEEQHRHLAQALAYLEALVGHPERWLLSADFFVTARLGTHTEVTLALAWTAEAFHALTTRLEGPHERVRHLPQIVRHAVPSPERRRKILLQLAQLGFTDALEAADLLALARRPGGLADEQTAKALDGMERIAREAEHPGAMVAQVSLANTYAKTIWGAFCSETLSQPEKEGITGQLLQRAEAIAEAAAADTLDLTIQFVAGCMMHEPLRSFSPSDEEGIAYLDRKSPAGRLWAYLDGWAGPRGSRRAAYGRALRETWRLADVFRGPQGPKKHQVATLLLPSWRLSTTALLEPEFLAPAVLSAQWEDKPTDNMGVTLVDPTGKESSVDHERLLAAGVDIVASHPEKAIVDEAVLTYPFHLAALGHDVRVDAPPEAVLLRLSDEKFPEMARQLAYLQGIHDGRAYRYLMELASAPENVETRRRYAQTTVVAPWRLVREDPTVIRTWRARPDDGRTFPNSLENLCEMLSEPPVALPEQGSLRDVLDNRLQDEGAWGGRLDKLHLIRMACEIPGAMAVVAAHWRLKDEHHYPIDVALALRRLDTANDWPMGQLCADIFFLRLAATHRPVVKIPRWREEKAKLAGRDKFVPYGKKTKKKSSPRERDGLVEGDGVREVDLREELPALLANVLHATKEAPPPDSLAHVEPALLRLCGQVVQRLSPMASPRLKDGVWLAHRLFRWLWAQLEALPDDARRAGWSALARVAPPPLTVSVEDLLHPLNLDRDRHDLRLASVLLALAFMEDAATPAPGVGAEPSESSVAPAKPYGVSSAALERLLVDLAARPLTDDERQIRRRSDEPSCLDWHGPGALPDLALTALLKLNEERFVDLPAEARLRWLDALPREQGDKTGVSEQLEKRIVLAFFRQASRLTQAEHVALEDYARRRGGYIRWILLTTLFAVGRQHLAPEVRDDLLAHLDDAAAPSGFGGYIATLALQAPDRLEAEVDQVLAEVQARGRDPVPFAVGLGSGIFSAKRGGIPALREVLRRLASQPPYQGDERMKQLMRTLGLSDRAAQRRARR